MRALAFAVLLCGCTVLAGEPTCAQPWPPWDGQESVEQYAKRANLPPTRTLDLGNGVNLELVLIPAGKFNMGTPELESPWVGGAILIISGLIALVLISIPFKRAQRQDHLQFSLRGLILLVMIIGVAQYGGFRGWRALNEQRTSKWDHPSYYGETEHEVTLTCPFYLGKYEVTQAQYQATTRDNPSSFTGDVHLPVERVSWDDAQTFCEQLSTRTGARVRLPTEAEWEYACRAGTTARFNLGNPDSALYSAGWCVHAFSMGAGTAPTTHPVGQKTPNAWGLFDMHGNVSEWCQDWRGGYLAGSVTDPQGVSWGKGRVLRGGGSNAPEWSCRSASRDAKAPEFGHRFDGFRVAISAGHQ